MTHERATIRTGDGDCPVQFFTPSDGVGPWPAVILYMDAGGIRPGVEGMAARRATARASSYTLANTLIGLA